MKLNLLWSVCLWIASAACAQSDVSGHFLLNGDARITEYLPVLMGKRVAVVANHTAMIKGVHLVDTLLHSDVNVIKVFAPEHGFRGDVPAGEKVGHGVDAQTGIKIVSLYGKHVAPDSMELSDVDVVLFDIQDVGVRFYTYLTTMKNVMESCNLYGKNMLILDRPNPNGHFVDGPILDMQFELMVGALPIPVVHGCTMGEMAKMIVGEGWLSHVVHSELFQVIPCVGYRHDGRYSLHIPPSPNLSSDCAIQWYPSLCFFEGTSVSVGRGTIDPFTCYGFPTMQHGDIFFTPVSIAGKVTHPPYENEICKGVDLRSRCDSLSDQLDLSFLLSVYQELGAEMFTSPSFFDKLAGNDELRTLICEGKTAEEIRLTWQEDIAEYKIKRKKYLLYP